MAKTVFAHGTIVTPEFLNLINDQSNLGLDADGSAPKVRFQDINGFVHDSFNVAFSGFVGGDQLVNIKYSIIYPYSVGTLGLVFLWFGDEVHGPDPATTLLTTQGNVGYDKIPEELRPATGVIQCPFRMTSGGQHNCPGSVEITTDGYLRIIRDEALSDGVIRPNISFPTTGDRGWSQQVIHYPIMLV